ncbi:4855_t:CDS:2 [Entrophospora sp. SA101]|nr:4855_t:CDS:2 [Entrophospora sp. SA101]
MTITKSPSSTSHNNNKRYRDEKQIFTSLTKGRKQNHYNRRLKLTINMRRQNFMNQTIRLKPNHLHQRLTITVNVIKDEKQTFVSKKTDLYVFNERIKIEQSSSTSKINDRRDKYEKTNFYES